MSKRRCGLCGRDPAAGFASIGDTFYCHGDEDPEPTCYMRSQHRLIGPCCVECGSTNVEAWAEEATDNESWWWCRDCGRRTYPVLGGDEQEPGEPLAGRH